MNIKMNIIYHLIIHFNMLVQGYMRYIILAVVNNYKTL